MPASGVVDAPAPIAPIDPAQVDPDRPKPTAGTVEEPGPPGARSATFAARAPEVPGRAASPTFMPASSATAMEDAVKLGEKRGAIIEGSVTAGGGPANRLSVTIHVERGAEEQPVERTAFAGESGFRFEGVPIGRAELEFECVDKGGTRRYRRETVQVTGARLYRVNVDFGPAAAVAGVVLGLREGEAVGVLAFLGDYDVPAEVSDDLYDYAEVADAECVVRADGSYRIDGLEPGLYTVVALADDRFRAGHREDDPEMWYVVERVTLQEGRETTLNLSLE